MLVRETNPGGAADSFLINEGAAAGAVPAIAVNSQAVREKIYE